MTQQTKTMTQYFCNYVIGMLSTVKIIKGVYSNFKRVSFESDVTLQKLVNRTVERYVSDDGFRKEMNEYSNLQISGSQF